MAVPLGVGGEFITAGALPPGSMSETDPETDPPLDTEQVAATLAGLLVTVVVAAETVLGLIDVLPQGAPLLLLMGWLLWFLKLYAQDRVPPLFPAQ